MFSYSNVIVQIIQQLNRLKILQRATFRQRAVSGVVFLVLFVFFGLLAIGAHYKIVRWPFPCGFQQEYNLPCPGCGITTSVVAFAQGRVFEAFYIQPAAAFLCSVLVVTAILSFLISVFGVYFVFLERFFNKVKVKHIILVVLIIIACGWAVTLARALAARSQS